MIKDNSKNKKIRALMLTLVMVLAILGLAGCGGNGGEEAPELTGWEYIQDKGELIVGLDDTFAPMGFRDESNNLVGFDVDMANAVGEILGVTITFQPIDWDSK